MPRPARPSSPASGIRPRIRVLRGKEIALGPGKADLLAAIGETGSIAEAARRLRMSYMRAWTLLQTMNRCFRSPLVDTTRGGAVRGGAVLTEEGQAVLDLYRRMESEALAAMAPAAAELARRLAPEQDPSPSP
jgi:molybdate transport system regulatory protein